MKQVICETGRVGIARIRRYLIAVGIAALSAACLAEDKVRPTAEKRRTPKAAAEPVPAIPLGWPTNAAVPCRVT